MEIQILRRQGKGIREIVKLTGHSRNTVRKYLRDGQAEPQPTLRVKRASKLDPFKAYIVGRIKAAKPDRLPANVLLREIAAMGYTGRERILRTFIAELCQKPPEEPIVRFETSPGRQAQVDWCVFRRGQRSLSAFVMTLGHSRFTYVEFVTDERFETLRACHEHAFAAIGGVPHEVLYDNMRTVVIERNAHGQGKHRFHPGLWDVAKHFGFVPRLCAPYRAQTKGKVERFIGYLRRSFYVPLTSRLAGSGLVLDAATANAEVWRWLRDVANVREHATTGERPSDLLEQEAPELLPLPVRQTVQTPASKPLAKTAWPTEMLQRPPAFYESLLAPEVRP